LSLAVVGEELTERVVQLGIDGRSDDGWYPLSTVIISRLGEGNTQHINFSYSSRCSSVRRGIFVRCDTGLPSSLVS
jgi:hypothetical protein